ncbi:peroxiredoxin [Pelagibius litoralis]|uniref:Glutathione-dependent peroxiredoxin n=1 Tax=Pelagibius litoralis TaxID=374515 RepID=A0A967F0P0_9PROT|nr:peroxiredoxin [Pelagibius litoralis]NIA70847.1 peroxiredoxin [Pelagibius litoralis]
MMRSVGDVVPEVTFKLREGGEWLEKTSADYFRGRSVVVFALPGAFTPTCSSTHLPGYMALSKNLKAMGVDEILCLSVNDAFVMNAWAKDQGVDDEVAMLPDGSGHFTRAMGMLVDKDNLGFGERSWRYSMLVVDGVISKIFAEDRNEPGDPFAVSDAVTMLDFISETAGQQAASA